MVEPAIVDVDALPELIVAGRTDRVRATTELPALIVVEPHNVRWLTGFSGSVAWVVLAPDRTVLVTDRRYGDRARDETAGTEVEVQVGATQADLRRLVIEACRGVTEVGAESGVLSHARWQELSTDLHLVPADGTVESHRRAKDPAELARIAAAAAIADHALAQMAPRLGDGLTELDVRHELEHLMRRAGAEGPSYDTIVASGPEHAARPHHGAERRRIIEGDTVVIDVGALVDGYHSDMTRSYIIGEIDDRRRELYELVLAAQTAGLAAVRADVPAREVDAACRAVFDEAGVLDWYLHSTGHGVGLQIHEEPFEAPNSTTWNRPLSSSRVIPVFRSLVVMAGMGRPWASGSTTDGRSG